MKTIQKAMRRRKPKNCQNRELFSSVSELRNLKINLKKIEALKQTISHIQEVKEQVRLKIKELKKEIKKNS